MNWTSVPVDLSNIPDIVPKAQAMIKAGNPTVAKLFCVYTLENDDLLYVIPLLDFVDNFPEEKFENFKLYQVQ